MSFVFRRSYRGPVKAVVFDWAGTTVDFGCCAPANVFVDLFNSHGIAVTSEQAREPMGIHKKDHIRILLKMEPIAAQWEKKTGARPTEKDVESLFAEFVPRQVETIAKHADIIPGALETIAAFRAKGIKIGSTTGYNGEMMAVLTPLAAKAGYTPDTMVSVSDVPEGRPSPWMALEAVKRMNVYPLEACVKVGDTPADIGEGLNAGMWSVGLVDHGNEVGLTAAEFAALSPEDRAAKCAKARQRLVSCGAHFVIDTIAQLPATIDEINCLLARGERP
ncbi:MAG: phosphonoacetaldehyde hydrolase [Candidatus Hydrogenedentes bacterium]|nr:phosphonoacetaldehyde hydrolase [Candidatus Hydrogenedentota bacterium]